jgi:hypothetical protein
VGGAIFEIVFKRSEALLAEPHECRLDEGLLFGQLRPIGEGHRNEVVHRFIQSDEG